MKELKKGWWQSINVVVLALMFAYMAGFGALIGAHHAGRLVGVSIVIVTEVEPTAQEGRE